MVNGAETFGIDPAAGHPERALALGYAPADKRGVLFALFALDATLAKLTLGSRDPLVAQMRLMWWYEALTRLSDTSPAQPILRVLRTAQIDGAALAGVTDGWERLLEAPDTNALNGYAAGRARLFVTAAEWLGATGDPVDAAGKGWALADLARVSGAPATRALAAAMASPVLTEASGARWGRNGRALGALTHSARMDLFDRAPPAAPSRIARLAWHRLTGR